jgi:hypothetical protein
MHARRDTQRRLAWRAHNRVGAASLVVVDFGLHNDVLARKPAIHFPQFRRNIERNPYRVLTLRVNPGDPQ